VTALWNPDAGRQGVISFQASVRVGQEADYPVKAKVSKVSSQEDVTTDAFGDLTTY